MKIKTKINAQLFVLNRKNSDFSIKIKQQWT